ncbi:SMP-30/gluconolactonase/LRE family protein [Leekyejoonella antrihumi]|uniref:SMP-30/gluconolactonase/LRE family protein n=1 Tax=Leekyejoonella antrihumi TaxID=1660198 RepID=A0A563E6Q0_9MICO|nr:SMP-30/gluconolactonase/LRE family protein [Leekyejoonella antrihumi]TWP38196.1 SMP-30/gluconolactonase/LRE family protein [Leekyejoonella antrihumi]
MTEREIQTVVSGMSYTECPRWHDGRLWFVDFYTHAIYSVTQDGSEQRVEVEVPAQPSGLGWLPDGRLVFVSMKDSKVMRREPDGALVVHADVAAFVGGHPNDMVVDGQGRCWLGDFGFDLMGGADIETTGLLRIDPDGSVTQVATDLWFPNGSVVTPDGSTLIVDETFGNRISAFEIRPDGSLGERRDWARFGDLPTSRVVAQAVPEAVYGPDGCCLDAQGALWVADAVGGRVCRVAEGGEIRETITPGTGVFACMLGGSDGRTLFMSCAPDFDEHARSAAREADIRAVTVDVPHAGLP